MSDEVVEYDVVTGKASYRLKTDMEKSLELLADMRTSLAGILELMQSLVDVTREKSQ
jgi:hypothetical protein